jgi:hydroxymethylpyrimidine/phosphomethylpyrimidine kinase
MNSNTETPIALTIAGSDSGGGAGIQADLKTFSALGVFGCSAITSLTAQNTLGVQGVFVVPPQFVQQQIQSVMSDIQVGAIKTGMLANADIISALVESLTQFTVIPLVVDPVMVATSGDRLLAEDAIEILLKKLMPLATIVTPNLHEAAALLNCAVARTRNEMQQQGEIFSAPRLQTKNTHGTGCTLASAVAAGLAKKLSLNDAVREAKDYLQGALAASNQLSIGKGSGPVHHFFKFY